MNDSAPAAAQQAQLFPSTVSNTFSNTSSTYGPTSASIERNLHNLSFQEKERYAYITNQPFTLRDNARTPLLMSQPLEERLTDREVSDVRTFMEANPRILEEIFLLQNERDKFGVSIAYLAKELSALLRCMGEDLEEEKRLALEQILSKVQTSSKTNFPLTAEIKYIMHETD